MGAAPSPRPPHTLPRPCSLQPWPDVPPPPARPQVGCYYMVTRQFEQARRYFGKATGLEPNCAAAWIAFGHAFSAQDERDQVGAHGG